SVTLRPPPCSTLFPYTTLFRSSNGRPDAGVQLKPQAGTKFVTDPKGDTVTLKGKNGLEVVISGADMHTSYSGATDWVDGFTTLRSEEHTSELQSRSDLVCRLLL